MERFVGLLVAGDFVFAGRETGGGGDQDDGYEGACRFVSSWHDLLTQLEAGRMELREANIFSYSPKSRTEIEAAIAKGKRSCSMPYAQPQAPSSSSAR